MRDAVVLGDPMVIGNFHSGLAHLRIAARFCKAVHHKNQSVPCFKLRLAVVAIHADRNGTDAAVLDFPRENRARLSAPGESDEGLFRGRFRGS